jgi:hypothetical protein
MAEIEKTVIGAAEVWTEGEERKVYYKPFNGAVLELDLTPYSFQSSAQAGAFIARLVDRAAWDSMILANLRLRQREGKVSP